MLVFMLVVLMWMRMYLAGGVNVAVCMDQTRLLQQRLVSQQRHRRGFSH